MAEPNQQMPAQQAQTQPAPQPAKTQPAPQPSQIGAVQPQEAPKKGKLLKWLLVVVLILVVGAGIWYWFQL